MGKYEKLLAKILRGTSDANIDFVSLCQLLVKLGFNQRIKGDHFIFSKDGIPEIINIQPKKLFEKFRSGLDLLRLTF